MTTGEKIKAARKAAGLTQKQLGERLGLSFQAIAQWENDLRNPKYETLQRIATALDVSMTYFMDENEIFHDEFRQGHVSMDDIADKMHLPVEIVWEILQSDDPAYQEEKEEITRIGAALAYSVDYQLSRSALEEIAAHLKKLNYDGQKKAVERVEELTEIPKYRRDTETPPEAPDGPPEAK